MSQLVDAPIATILSQADLHAALLVRHGGGRSFEGRDSYIGASEAGVCPASVAYRKLHPEIKPDAKGAGRMLAGTALENEGVQLARGIFGRDRKSVV